MLPGRSSLRERTGGRAQPQQQISRRAQEVTRVVAGGTIGETRMGNGDQAVGEVPGAVAGVGAVDPTIVGVLLFVP